MRALILAPLFVASVARADVESARNDIVDMRKGRMPARSEVLGWTDDGAFVMRRTDCVVQDTDSQGIIVYGNGAVLTRVISQRNGEEGLTGVSCSNVALGGTCIEVNMTPWSSLGASSFGEKRYIGTTRMVSMIHAK